MDPEGPTITVLCRGAGARVVAGAPRRPHAGQAFDPLGPSSARVEGRAPLSTRPARVGPGQVARGSLHSPPPRRGEETSCTFGSCLYPSLFFGFALLVSSAPGRVLEALHQTADSSVPRPGSLHLSRSNKTTTVLRRHGLSRSSRGFVDSRRRRWSGRSIISSIFSRLGSSPRPRNQKCVMSRSHHPWKCGSARRRWNQGSWTKDPPVPPTPAVGART